MKKSDIFSAIGILAAAALVIFSVVNCFETHYNIHQDLEKNSSGNYLSTYVEKRTPNGTNFVYGSNVASLDSTTKAEELKKAKEFVKESKAFDEK